MLEARNIHKSYGNLEVLKGINVNIKKGEVVSIVGASGAGKSTLLHVLGTLDRPDKGELFIDEENILRMTTKAMALLRSTKIGFVFQSHNLLPEFTALENISMPGYIAGTPLKEINTYAHELMNTLKISERKDNKPSQLSGGEQQRVSVARALINNPSIVFADEPSGNLDSKNADELHNLFFQLREKYNQTFIIVTHNRRFADMADRKLEIVDGIIKK